MPNNVHLYEETVIPLVPILVIAAIVIIIIIAVVILIARHRRKHRQKHGGYIMKYCFNCGKELEDGAVFCSACGVRQPEDGEIPKDGPEAVPDGADAIDVTNAGEMVPDVPGNGPEKKKRNKREKPVNVDADDPHASKNVVLCMDGKYRWVYEVNLFKDFWVLGYMYKIFGGIILGMGVIYFIIQLFGDHEYRFVLEMVGIMCGIFLVLGLIGYLVYAAIMGGKYCVVYTMDDKGILSEQQPKQAKKANIIADLLVLAGALSGNLTTVGMGLSSARKTSMHTTFAGTKKLKGVARRGLIKMDSLFSHDRTYCEQEDFNFVWNYVKSRCEGAKITEKF